jgi:hypothetical protein
LFIQEALLRFRSQKAEKRAKRFGHIADAFQILTRACNLFSFFSADFSDGRPRPTEAQASVQLEPFPSPPRCHFGQQHTCILEPASTYRTAANKWVHSIFYVQPCQMSSRDNLMFETFGRTKFKVRSGPRVIPVRKALISWPPEHCG